MGALCNRNDRLGAEAQVVPVRTSHTRAIYLVRLDPSSDLNPDLGSLRFPRLERGEQSCEMAGASAYRGAESFRAPQKSPSRSFSVLLLS